ncbi:DNA primase [Streptomyces sp. AJS327]|uniref:phage/plasmid primase, P4 family n=1 Tax=Streptomyces sp. AJS327 TaxID=2545265 RepID=UPI0015DE8F1F|nr:phage/plasmid primase, P4 family [Streptomyces sp. AJS327]MBA0054316.1 DNA primase [Streptomyces sp. AJS327]
MNKNLSEFLTRFPEVVEERGEYGVPCVAHNDHRPSLFFRLKEDGRLLIRCWAGCDQADILAGLGMGRGDLFDWVPGDGVKVSGKPVAGGLAPGDLAGLAMYVDDCNIRFPGSREAVAYVADRFGLGLEKAVDMGLGFDSPAEESAFPYRGPAFRQFPRLTVPLNNFDGFPRGLQGRDLSGHCPSRWLSLTSPEGSAWAKYGVFRANSGFDTLLITEGPGDALTAVGVGYDAVAVRGAGLARNAGLIEELARGLGDRDVVLAGDRDNAGAAFTGALADALVRAGVMVRKLEIPAAGDDLTDWRARDTDAFPGELHAAVRRAPLHLVDPTPEHVPDPQEVPKEEKSKALPLTDLGNAERLFLQLGGHVRMVPGAGVFKWTGKNWTQVPQEALYADVRAVIKGILREEDHDQDKLNKHWAASQDARKVKAMVDMLSSIPGVYATADQFDATPYLMSFRNVVVDLRDGSFREHRPEDMNTFFIDVDYKPEAKAERWERFLRECHPGCDSMPGFLQELTGYGITGYGVERIFVMHVGPTTNGKTTFTATVEDVFKAATKRADAALFQRRRESGGPRADVVGLRGRRLVISSEWPANMPLDQALMKAVTGDQNITARGVYAKTEITFKPVCLVQVDTNYVPEVDPTDAALWQRVRVVPWNEDFRSREDRHLQATLRQEREGIAAWAVAGAVAWYRKYENGQGLDFPEAVEKRTAHYRDSSHPLSGFIGEEFEVEEGAFVPKAETWTRYQTWAEECGIRHTMTRNKFYDAVRTFPGVMEGQGTGAEKGKRGFRNLADVKAVRPPQNASESDVFGQPRA